MNLVDIIRRALSGQEPEERCDCLRCVQHRVPSLRGRTFGPEEWAALHATATEYVRDPWPEHVLAAEQAADQALVDYTELELVWLSEIEAAQKRWAQGYRGTDLNDRRDAARGLLDESATKLTEARARHAALCRQVEAQWRAEAAAAVQAESEAEVQEQKRSRWLEILGR